MIADESPPQRTVEQLQQQLDAERQRLADANRLLAKLEEQRRALVERLWEGGRARPQGGHERPGVK